MKKILLTLTFLCICFLSFGQNTPKVGEQLIVKSPTSQYYKHVKFPKLNILVKRGKLATYKPVIGNTVVVDQVVTKDNGNTYVVLKKKDGSKFFGLLTTVEANYQKAIKSGELVAK